MCWRPGSGSCPPPCYWFTSARWPTRTKRVPARWVGRSVSWWPLPRSSWPVTSHGSRDVPFPKSWRNKPPQPAPDYLSYPACRRAQSGDLNRIFDFVPAAVLGACVEGRCTPEHTQKCLARALLALLLPLPESTSRARCQCSQNVRLARVAPWIQHSFVSREEPVRAQKIDSEQKQRTGGYTMTRLKGGGLFVRRSRGMAAW